MTYTEDIAKNHNLGSNPNDNAKILKAPDMTLSWWQGILWPLSLAGLFCHQTKNTVLEYITHTFDKCTLSTRVQKAKLTRNWRRDVKKGGSLQPIPDSIAVSVFLVVLVEFNEYYQILSKANPNINWWWDEQARNLTHLKFSWRSVSVWGGVGEEDTWILKVMAPKFQSWSMQGQVFLLGLP